MVNINDILLRVNSGIRDEMAKCGFTVVVPEGTPAGSLPAVINGEKIAITYTGENRAMRMEYFDKKLSVLGCLKEGEISDGDYAPVTQIFIDPDDADDKQIKYYVNEICDSVGERFGRNAEEKLKRAKKQPMPTVSKKAVENGSSSYDAVSLASRFTGIYKDLAAPFRENFETYGEFLADDFFTNYGNAAVLDTITRNKPDEMKKLFTIFNEMYLDGTGAVQSLIAVTILGSLNNNQELLSNCVDYMCKELLAQVINVNKRIDASNSKKMRLANPPAYKPKKKGKKSIGSRIGQ